jgi:hypothetical protein
MNSKSAKEIRDTSTQDFTHFFAGGVIIAYFV